MTQFACDLLICQCQSEKPGIEDGAKRVPVARHLAGRNKKK
jgi:hypothetical protein